ncbi:MAG TPA: phage major capsid protein [Gaiellaceae bacterium]|nr:phage major capsid protein [Gaiellaceae bacterium]
MSPTTTVLEQELREATARARELEAAAATDRETAEKLVADLKEQGKDPLKDAEAFAQVDAAYKVGSEKLEQAAETRRRIDALMEHLGHRKPDRSAQATLPQTAADAIMALPEWERMKETGAFTSPQGRIDLPGVEVVGRADLVARLNARQPILAVDTPVDGAALVDVDQRRYPPVGIPVRPLRLLDMIGVTTTDSDSVVYVQETTRTDAAAETALGTAYGEADYAYSEVTANVKDIGHWTPAHRSQLADRGQLQGLIAGRLSYGVEARLDTQIVQGDGTGSNLTGILNTDNIGSINRNGTASERKIEAIHRGITWIRLHGFVEPDGLGIHPQDYEDVLFEKDDNNNYLLPGVLQGVAGATPMTIWGKPCVVTTAFPQHSVVPGLYKAGATAYMRAGVSVRATDSHSDFFTKRMVALLAEMRVALAVEQPNYFAEVDVS